MTSVVFVEKALIGSLLNDSTRRNELPWLGAEDFTNPLCQAIWHHLESGSPPNCQPLIDLVEMSQILGCNYQLHAMLRGPAELATLQVQAPEKPAVVEYGRILVEATIRREVSAMGLRLELLAADQPEQIIDGVADALASLNGLDQRRRVSMGHHPELDSELRIASKPLAAETTSPTKGSTNVNTAVVGDLMDHHLAEKAVIGAAVHDWPPRARARVLGRIRECDFTDPRTTLTWRAVEYLAEHDAVIDEVTVAWQALRAQSRSGNGLTVQELRETRAAAIFHEAATTALARSSMTRIFERAVVSISRGAEDQRIGPKALIESATSHHVAVGVAAERLKGERLAMNSTV